MPSGFFRIPYRYVGILAALEVFEYGEIEEWVEIIPARPTTVG